MLKLTQIKIQESPKLRGVNMDKGITTEDMTCDRILFEQVVHDSVHGKMLEVLSNIIDQVADVATANGKDGEAVRASMVANVMKFKLDAGGGYTDNHKAYLLENGTASGVEVVAEDFVDPKNRGGSTPSTKNEVTVDIVL